MLLYHADLDVQLNHDDLDHHHLVRGGGYIVEDGDMLKSFATNFPSRVHHYHHHLFTTLKNQKNEYILIPTT